MTDFDDVVATRRSVRGFYRARPVPRDVLVSCLELAQRSPSNCNVQPWNVTIVSGDLRDRLSERLVQAATSGEPPSVRIPIESFRDDYRRRQVACAVEMYGKMGIAKDDGAGRLRAHVRNYEFFDAPHVAVVTMDKSFGIGVAIDVGIWVQSFMLALWSRGIGSCAQASLRLYPDIISDVLGLPASEELLCGISFGYEDPSTPANQTRQPREPIDRLVRFVD